MEKNPYTDESAAGRIDPSKTLQTRLRSEEASGSLTNTSEETAQSLRRMRARPRAAPSAPGQDGTLPTNTTESH
jgi:hypothetical protein